MKSNELKKRRKKRKRQVLNFTFDQQNESMLKEIAKQVTKKKKEKKLLNFYAHFTILSVCNLFLSVHSQKRFNEIEEERLLIYCCNYNFLLVCSSLTTNRPGYGSDKIYNFISFFSLLEHIFCVVN